LSRKNIAFLLLDMLKTRKCLPQVSDSAFALPNVKSIYRI